MNMKLNSKLKKNILDELADNLSPELHYHDVAHTREDVLPVAERLAHISGVTGEDRLLLQTAALLHDVGYLQRYENNEPLAVDVARKILPDYNYRPEQIETIASIIMATAMPQQPKTLLEQIMCDADLDSLGRDDFWDLSKKLHRELACYGQQIPEKDWLTRQFTFLESHTYFTQAAQQMRNAGKADNLRRLKEMIANHSSVTTRSIREQKTS